VANLDVKLQCSPTLYDHGILVLRYAKCRTEGTPENAGNRGVSGLGLLTRLGLPGAEGGDPYRSCYCHPILAPDLHPSIFLWHLFFALLSVVEGLSVRLGRNRGEERQKFVLKRVKVKTQELFRVFLVPTLRHKLSWVLFVGRRDHYSLSCYQIAS